MKRDEVEIEIEDRFDLRKGMLAFLYLLRDFKLGLLQRIIGTESFTTTRGPTQVVD